jgi:hypothetical protein
MLLNDIRFVACVVAMVSEFVLSNFAIIQAALEVEIP